MCDIFVVGRIRYRSRQWTRSEAAVWLSEQQNKIRNKPFSFFRKKKNRETFSLNKIVRKHFHFIIKMKQTVNLSSLFKLSLGFVLVLTINNQKLLLLEIIKALRKLLLRLIILFHMTSELKYGMPFSIKTMRFRNMKKLLCCSHLWFFPNCEAYTNRGQ